MRIRKYNYFISNLLVLMGVMFYALGMLATVLMVIAEVKINDSELSGFWVGSFIYLATAAAMMILANKLEKYAERLNEEGY